MAIALRSNWSHHLIQIAFWLLAQKKYKYRSTNRFQASLAAAALYVCGTGNCRTLCSDFLLFSREQWKASRSSSSSKLVALLMLGQPSSFCFPFLFAECFVFPPRLFTQSRAPTYQDYWVFFLAFRFSHIYGIWQFAFSIFSIIFNFPFFLSFLFWHHHLSWICVTRFSSGCVFLLGTLISVCWESKTKRELLTFDSGNGSMDGCFLGLSGTNRGVRVPMTNVLL